MRQSSLNLMSTGKISENLVRGLLILSSLAGLGMVLIVLLSVFQRYVLKSPLSYSEEMVGLLLCSMLFLSIPYISSYEKVEKSGKLWIGIGYKEEFSVSDWITVPASIKDIQKFHKEENTNTELTPKPKSSDYSNRYIFLSICALFASVAILIIYLRRKSKIQKGYKKD